MDRAEIEAAFPFFLPQDTLHLSVGTLLWLYSLGGMGWEVSGPGFLEA